MFLVITVYMVVSCLEQMERWNANVLGIVAEQNGSWNTSKHGYINSRPWVKRSSVNKSKPQPSVDFRESESLHKYAFGECGTGRGSFHF